MEEIKPAATGSENATQEQGYLMAYDKKEQKAKGVKGIAANGELETLEANETNKDRKHSINSPFHSKKCDITFVIKVKKLNCYVTSMDHGRF